MIDVALGRATRPPFPIGSSEPPAFAPDGRLLLIGGNDGKLHQIDLATGTERWSRDFGAPVRVGQLEQRRSPRHRRTFDQDLRILDAATGADVAGPFPGVAGLQFSPSGDTLLAVGDELRILDSHTGTVLRTLTGHGGLLGGAFVREGRWISAITGSGLDELIDVESGNADRSPPPSRRRRIHGQQRHPRRRPRPLLRTTTGPGRVLRPRSHIMERRPATPQDAT